MGLEVPLSELFQYRREEGYPSVELRRRLDGLVNEASDDELLRLTRIFEALRE